jgi:tetratricopeptide (TPR) repeat protein
LHQNHRVACFRAGAYEEAREAAHARLAEKPKDALVRARCHADLAFAWRGLGELAKMRTENRRARQALREAAALPNAPAFQLGRLATRLGLLEEARHWHERAVASSPGSPMAHLALAEVHFLMNERPASVRAARRAVSLDPRVPDGHRWLGRALASTGDTQGAAEAYRRSLAASPRDAQVAAWLGSTLRKLGDRAGSLRAFRRAVALDPGHPTFLADLGVLLIENGHYEEAVETLRRAKVRDAKRPSGREIEPWLRLAERRAAALPEVRALLTEGVEPEDARVYVVAAHERYARGAYAEATRLFTTGFDRGAAAPPSRFVGDRHFAAAAAVRASCTDVDAAALRGRALRWLREELELIRNRPGHLTYLSTYPEFDPVRTQEGLAALPPDEAEAWFAFWLEVRRLREG